MIVHCTYKYTYVHTQTIAYSQDKSADIAQAAAEKEATAKNTTRAKNGAGDATPHSGKRESDSQDAAVTGYTAVTRRNSLNILKVLGRIPMEVEAFCVCVRVFV